MVPNSLLVWYATRRKEESLHIWSVEMRSHAIILVSQAFGNPHPHLNLSRCVFQDIVSLSFLYIKYKAQ